MRFVQKRCEKPFLELDPNIISDKTQSMQILTHYNIRRIHELI